MIFLTVFLSIFSWGNNCQFSENLTGFQVQCHGTQALWQQLNLNQSRFTIKLEEDLQAHILFDKKLNNDYSLSSFQVDKGLRSHDWLRDQDFYFIKQIQRAIHQSDFVGLEAQLFQRSIDYLMDLPLYESLESLSRASQKTIRAGYTLICRSIGKRKHGYYTVDEKKFSKRVWVGRESSDCYGRCGSGCGASSQYTQECLNHDICNRDTGQNLGVCSDEFWAASDGYFSAPNCQ